VRVHELASEQHVVINVAEHDRLLTFVLATPVPRPPPAPPERPSVVLPATLTAVAFVGVALFAGLGGGGRVAQARLLDSPCAQTKMCDPASVAALHRQYVAADVSLVVGVIAAGFAAWRWWLYF